MMKNRVTKKEAAVLKKLGQDFCKLREEFDQEAHRLLVEARKVIGFEHPDHDRLIWEEEAVKFSDDLDDEDLFAKYGIYWRGQWELEHRMAQLREVMESLHMTPDDLPWDQE